MANVSYMGKGSIYLKGATGGLIPVGNVSKLSFSIDEEKKELSDYENAGGGVVDSVSRITGVKLAMTAHSFSARNLAMALRGASAENLTVTAIVDEVATAYKGALVQLSRLVDVSVAPVVTNSAATVTYVDGTDYTVTRAGLIIPATSTIADATSIKVDYTPLADDLVQALTGSAQDFHMVFDGLNEARSGKAVLVNAFRVRFSPTKGLDLIADEFGSLEFEADVLKDETKTGTGVSQYLTVRMAA